MSKFKQAVTILCAALLLVSGWGMPVHAQDGSGSYAAGRRWANWYAFGYGRVPGGFITSGNTSTGSQTITICAAQVALPDGRTVNILGGRAGIAPVPITVDPQNSAVTETVTPTAVSLISPPNGVNMNQAFSCANVTASFSFLHGASNNSHQVLSGDFGVQEAIDDAQINGGGIVVIDGSWQGGTANITATPYTDVTIEDSRNGIPQIWTAQPTATTLVAAPPVLTAATAGFGVNGATSTGGTYTGSNTYITCFAGVDVAGNEGPCSPTFTVSTSGSATTNQIGYTAPAALTGAVGYTLYITLNNGNYNVAYQVPLTTGVCTLTKVETVTPACAITNTAYNQVGSGAVVSALTVNTSPIALQLSGVSTTSIYVGASNARTIYGYVPGNKTGTFGTIANIAFPLTAVSTAATTVPADIGVLAVPAGYMNVAGRSVRVCVKAITTGNGTSDTIEGIQLLWDGAGSDTAGAPVIVGNMQGAASANTAAVWTINACDVLQTTVSGVSVTAGSINTGTSSFMSYLASAPATPWFMGGEKSVAAIASLNLAGGAGFTSRIHIVYQHTGGTDTSMQLLSATVEAL